MKTVIKRIVWVVCLTISIGFTIQFFYSFSEDSFFRAVVVAVVIAVEGFAQYVWGLALAAWKNLQFKAVFLTLAYALYLVVFAFLSGLSYFVDELAVKEQGMEQAAFQQQVNRQKWEQNNKLLDTYNKQLEFEAATGRGRNSKEIEAKIEALKAEQSILEASFEVAETEVEVDTFAALAELFGIPAEKLKLFVFGTAVMFIYLGLMLTNPETDQRATKENQSDPQWFFDQLDSTGQVFPLRPLGRSEPRRLGVVAQATRRKQARA